MCIQCIHPHPSIHISIYTHTYTLTHDGEREAGAPAPEAGEAGAGHGGAVHDGGQDVPGVAFICCFYLLGVGVGGWVRGRRAGAGVAFLVGGMLGVGLGCVEKKGERAGGGRFGACDTYAHIKIKHPTCINPSLSLSTPPSHHLSPAPKPQGSYCEARSNAGEA